MISDIVKNSKSYQYALWCVEKDNKKVGKYIKKQCEEFIKIANGEDDRYYIDIEQLEFINTLTKFINIMPKKNAYNNLVGFKWFFIINALCVRRTENCIRIYELSILLIARKNGRR